MGETIRIVIAIGLAVFGIGLFIQNAPKSNVPSACTIINVPVSATCMEYANTCKYEDGNVDGRPCFWINDGKVWYIDGSEYLNDND